MISIIKSIIWIAGILTVAYFVAGYFGYTVNPDYFKSSRQECEQKLRECSDQFIRKGLENAQCDFVCVDPKLIIKKK